MKVSKSAFVAVILFFTAIIHVSPGYAQVTETYCSTDVPVIIPANVIQTVTSVLTVPDPGRITNVVVALQIDHPFAVDLEVSLISPQSTEIRLFSHVAPNLGGDFGTTCTPFPDFILDDSASMPVSAYIPGTPGTFIPQQPLSTFASEQQAGIWTLQIFDGVAPDGGSLNCWCLEITVAGAPPVVTSSIPTMSEWGLLTTAGIMGIAAVLFIIARRRKSAA